MRILNATISGFKIPLGYRLLLATIPIGGLLIVISIFRRFDGPNSTLIDWPGSVWIFSALFGVFVLVPFITTKSSLVLRVSALVLASILIPPVWLLIVESVGWSLGVVINFYMFGVVATTLLFAVVLVFVASLKVSRLYWLYTALAGIVGAYLLVYGISETGCWFVSGDCPRWRDYPTAISLLMWQLLFCTAVYFGRTDNRRGAQTASQH